MEDQVKYLWMREPVVVVNAVVAVLEAVFPVLLIFGIIDWSAEQIGAVMALILAVATAVKTVFARSQVTPVRDPRL